MQRGGLTLSETYKPPTPVMVNVPGTVGVTVKVCPKKKFGEFGTTTRCRSGNLPVGYAQCPEEGKSLRLQF